MTGKLHSMRYLPILVCKLLDKLITTTFGGLGYNNSRLIRNCSKATVLFRCSWYVAKCVRLLVRRHFIHKIPQFLLGLLLFR